MLNKRLIVVSISGLTSFARRVMRFLSPACVACRQTNDERRRLHRLASLSLSPLPAPSGGGYFPCSATRDEESRRGEQSVTAGRQRERERERSERSERERDERRDDDFVVRCSSSVTRRLFVSRRRRLAKKSEGEFILTGAKVT